MEATLEKRINSRKGKMLDMLRAAGTNGVLNTELQEVSLRYGGILGELYKEGYIIDNEQVEGGIYLYTLVEEPETKRQKPSSATDILFTEIRKGYGGKISAGELRKMLDDYGFNIVRKGGSHMRKRSTVQLRDLEEGDEVRLECFKTFVMQTPEGEEAYIKGKVYEGTVLTSREGNELLTIDEQGDDHWLCTQDLIDQHFKMYKEDVR